MRLFLLATIFLLFCPVFFLEQSSAVHAAEQNIKHDSSQPVNITADKLEADDKNGVFIFKGNVQARQDEFFIYAQKMTIFYSKKEADSASGEDQKRQVDKIVAEKDVSIVQFSRVATGQKAVFYQQQGRVVLTGEPRVVQGENEVEGERIEVYLNDSRSIVEGGKKQRVRAIFVPGDDQ
ncbi:MAG: lipopolysaccharide transport periplasmic protein LptA [Desulfobacteraceae bacterium 4572_35.1]|nr:MAG: lipopolysaccharide transport periplasmic protein LptA [Desulfobacteraceae bacterium 4572_35.1]